MQKISVDHSGHVDALGRVAFSRHIIELVDRIDAENGSVVLGLQGVWGSGKSSVLGNLPSILEERDEGNRPILVSFNPWMVSGTSGLVEALLLQMAAEIDRVVRKQERKLFWWRRFLPGNAESLSISDSLVRYASVLGTVKNFASVSDLFIPGSGLILSSVGKMSDQARTSAEAWRQMKQSSVKLSLTAARDQVQVNLRALKLRVVVLIDDLDRLPSAEMASMLQAIKAVANFSNVVYVMAYDPCVAARAVESALNVPDGNAFLEKIVQIPLPLPEVPARKMKRFAVERLRSSVETAGLDEKEAADLILVWPIAAAMMQSPRDVERLRTRLLVTSYVLRGKVNMADVVLLESLSLRVPDVLNWIQTNAMQVISIRGGYDSDLLLRGHFGDVLATAGFSVADFQRGKEQKTPFDWKDQLPLDARVVVPVQEAMGFLFDKCRGPMPGTIRRSEYRRVQEHLFWYQWLCYHDCHEQWSPEEVEKIFVNPEVLLAEGIHHDPDSFHELCRLICSIGSESLPRTDVATWVRVFVEIERTSGAQVMIGGSAGAGPLAALALCFRMDDESKLQPALAHLIETGSVWLSGMMVCGVWSDKEAIKQAPQPDEAMLEGLVKRWFGIADQYLAGPNWGASSQELCPYTLISWMSMIKRPAVVTRALSESFIGSEAEKLAVFFGSLADRFHSPSFALEVQWDSIPEPDYLLVLAEELPTFEESHSSFLEALKVRATSLKLQISEVPGSKA